MDSKTLSSLINHRAARYNEALAAAKRAEVAALAVERPGAVKTREALEREAEAAAAKAAKLRAGLDLRVLRAEAKRRGLGWARDFEDLAAAYRAQELATVAEVTRLWQASPLRANDGLIVHFASASASARSEAGTVWRKYGRLGNCKGTDATHHLDVRPDYLDRVPEAARLSGGLLCLDLDPETGAAVWARAGRGYDLVCEHGYILVDGDDVIHGATMDACRRTLARRRAPAKPAPAPGTKARLTTADSRRVGNCAAGTKAFCDTYLGGRTAATRSELEALLPSLPADIAPRVRAVLAA